MPSSAISDRPYQGRMTQAILEGNTLLAAPPGLGKTKAALDAIWTLVGDLQIERVLWCAPKIVCSDTIPNEVQKWYPGLLSCKLWDADALGLEIRDDGKLRIADPGDLVRRVRADRAQIHLIAHDHYYRFVVAIREAWPYELQVLDESWAFSDLDAGRFKAVLAVQHHFKTHTVLLNGTPIGNGLEKLWAQMLLVDGGASLGKSLTAFQAGFLEPEKVDRRKGRVFSWKPKDDAVARVVEACRGRLVTLLESDWLTLPPFIEIPISVDIPRVEYEQMERDALLEAEDWTSSAVNAGVLYNKLAQLACGVQFDETGAWHEIHRVKLDALLELREMHAGPLLIWTSYQPDIERICAAIPGAKQANKVKNLEAEWNAGRIHTLVAHPKTLAAGANMQDAPGSAMCWFGVTANALHWNQGIKRLHRSGRKEPVRCWVIVAKDTVEEAMLRARAGREAVETDVMAALAYRRPGLS